MRHAKGMCPVTHLVLTLFGRVLKFIFRLRRCICAYFETLDSATCRMKINRDGYMKCLKCTLHFARLASDSLDEEQTAPKLALSHYWTVLRNGNRSHELLP
jgi:hypothetical protein